MASEGLTLFKDCLVTRSHLGFLGLQAMPFQDANPLELAPSPGPQGHSPLFLSPSPPRGCQSCLLSSTWWRREFGSGPLV